jgi:hypothetical protein
VAQYLNPLSRLDSLHRHTALLPRRTATIYFECQTLATATKYVVHLDPFAHH